MSAFTTTMINAVMNVPVVRKPYQMNTNRNIMLTIIMNKRHNDNKEDL